MEFQHVASADARKLNDADAGSTALDDVEPLQH